MDGARAKGASLRVAAMLQLSTSALPRAGGGSHYMTSTKNWDILTPTSPFFPQNLYLVWVNSRPVCLFCLDIIYGNPLWTKIDLGRIYTVRFCH